MLRRDGVSPLRLMAETTAESPARREEYSGRPAPPRQSSRFAVEHESQQPSNFRFSGHELPKDPSEPDRFLGKLTTALVDACHIVPADPESSVDCFKHRVEPLRQVTLLRSFELNTAVADLRRGTHQALTHRRR
jgi:hypothetical protein